LSSSNQQRSGNKPIFNRVFLFPIGILVIYAILFFVSPDKVGQATKSSGNVFLSMLLPLALVFFVMLLINLFLKPAAVAKFLGKGSGVKGIILSAYLCLVPFAKRPQRERSRGILNCHISLQQGCQALSIAGHGQLLRLGLRSNIDYTYGFSISRRRILRKYFFVL